MKKTALPFVLMLVAGYCYTQVASLKFTRLTTNEGLSQGHISAILKDFKGFMWFATDGGLNKYDGYRFTAFKHDADDATSISSSLVYSIMEDDQRNLWVATHAGADRFDRKTDRFIHYYPGQNITVNVIFQDRKKRIWAGTEKGLYLLNTIKNRFDPLPVKRPEAVRLNSEYIYQLTEDNNGNLWIATRNGVLRFNPDSGAFTCYKHEASNPNSVSATWSRNVYKDVRGNIWVGTQGGGVSVFNPQTNNFKNYRHDPENPNTVALNDVLSFCEDNKGNIWIGTENGGISVLNPATGNFTTYANDPNDSRSLGNNSIYSLYKDSDDNIWIGTYSEGVNLLPAIGDKFVMYNQNPLNPNGLNNQSILALTGDEHGIIWVGTDGGGLNRFNPKTKQFTHYVHNPNNSNSINSNYVLSVINVDSNLLGIGLHAGGFDLFNTKTGKFTHHVPGKDSAHTLSTLSVNILCGAANGNVWVGTWGGGLNYYNTKQNSFTHYENDPKDPTSIISNFIYCIYEDRFGDLWVGSGDGLSRMKKGSPGVFTQYLHDDADKKTISQNFVQYIFEDHTGKLWIGTSGGLNYFDRQNGTFVAYTEKNGLANDMIQSCVEDKHGNFWLASNNGLTRFNPVTKLVKNYSPADGLQGKEFKPNSCFKAADGQIYFGGNSGFNVFNPDSLPENKIPPPVYFTDLHLFNKPVVAGVSNSPISQSISEAGEIVFSYQQSVFSLEFAALNYAVPEQNKYMYKLEGFDKDWSTPGYKRSVTYTNLDAGTYTFMVKASNNDGVWNDTPATISIVVTPPFWLTWWFKLLVLLAIVAILFAFYNFRVRLITHQKLLLQQKVGEQTLELMKLNEEERKSRLAAEEARAESEKARQETWLLNKALETKNKELEQFAYAASHDLQEPLRMVTGFLSQLEKKYHALLDDKGKSYIFYAVDGAKRMRQIIKDLLEYSRVGRTEGKSELVDVKEIVAETEILFSNKIIENNTRIKAGSLPVIKSYKAPLRQVFQNLIGNALKYGRKDAEGIIEVSALKIEKGWQFAVADNGIGIPQDQFENIFILFKRVPGQEDASGTGIGLAVTKKIIESFGGNIWVTSEEGKGSTFYFTIPEQSDAG